MRGKDNTLANNNQSNLRLISCIKPKHKLELSLYFNNSILHHYTLSTTTFYYSHGYHDAIKLYETGRSSM